MNVLLLTRPDSGRLGGGDAKMMRRLAENLSAFGVGARCRGDLHPDLQGIDLVHLSNLDYLPETLIQAEHCRRHGVPYVITPNYYPKDEYWRASEQHGLRRALRWLGADRMERLRALAKVRHAPSLLPQGLRVLAGAKAAEARILQHARAWLPGSAAEGEQLRRDFPGLERPIVPVPPFALESVAPGAPPPGLPEGPFVLCAARLEANKNQGLLIEAVGKRYPIVLAGAINPRHRTYADLVLKRLAACGGTYLGPLDAPALWATYRQARIHAQPSFYETAGLANLEAASQGCQIVTTNRGFARAFLGDGAFYAAPDDPIAWRAAISVAWQAPAVDWQERLAAYTWENMARKAQEAYTLALNGAH